MRSSGLLGGNVALLPCFKIVHGDKVLLSCRRVERDTLNEGVLHVGAGHASATDHDTNHNQGNKNDTDDADGSSGSGGTKLSG